MGKEEIPFILPGVLYQERRAMGDVDDVMEAKLQALDKMYRQSVKDAETLQNHEQRIKRSEASHTATKSSLQQLNTKLDSQVHSLQTKLGLAQKKIADLESLLRRMLPRLEPAKPLPPSKGDALPSSPDDSAVEQVEHSAEGPPNQPAPVPDEPPKSPVQADSKNQEQPVEQEE